MWWRQTMTMETTMLAEKIEDDCSSNVCCQCVSLKERKKNTKRDWAHAWMSQAIVPENLTQTQDILKTFMQLLSYKQYVIRMTAQVYVCMCLCACIPKIIFKLYSSMLLHVTYGTTFHFSLHLHLTWHAFTVWVLFIAFKPTACHLLWILHSHFKLNGRCCVISHSRINYVTSCGPCLCSWKTDWHVEPRWGD